MCDASLSRDELGGTDSVKTPRHGVLAARSKLGSSPILMARPSQSRFRILGSSLLRACVVGPRRPFASAVARAWGCSTALIRGVCG